MADAVQRPESLEAYAEWAKNTLEVDFASARQQKLYDINLTTALNTIQQSAFFAGLPACLRLAEDHHKAERRASLLMTPPDRLTLYKKPFKSSVDKTFRRNILWNRLFPREPQRGWVTPVNWYHELHDVLRSVIVCKFLDGPDFLAVRLAELATASHLESRYYSQERDEGYYAFHFYVTFDVTLSDEHLDDQATKVDLEIQLTTQLQDVLRDLTHPFYEQVRLKVQPDPGKWKWEHGTNRFRAGYLGHTLHLLEAIVVDLRNASPEPETHPPHE